MGESILYGCDVPLGWSIIKFADACDKISLNGIKIKQKEYLPEGKYPVVDQGQDLVGGFYNDKAYVVPQEPPYVVFGDHTKVKKYINFCFIAGADGIKVLKPQEFYDPKLLFYFLHAIKLPDKGYARHFQFLEKSEFPLPPLPEQHRIVAKIEELFSELDKGVEALKTVQQQLKVYRQAVLQWAFEGKLTEEWRKQQNNLPTVEQILEEIEAERVKQAEATGKKLKPMASSSEAELAKLPNGWQWVNLADASTDIFDGPFGSHLKSSDYTDDGVRVIRLENIGALEFNDQYRSYVAKEKYETIKKHTVYPDDIVFSSFISEKIRVALVPSHIQKAVNKADCFCIRANKTIIGEKYLACFLSTRAAYHQLVNEIHGATRPRINTTQLKSCWILYCSVEEQHQIVAEIESRLSVADKIEESIAQSLKQAEALRQSILKRGLFRQAGSPGPERRTGG